jgi:hypothetical protein
MGKLEAVFRIRLSFPLLAPAVTQGPASSSPARTTQLSHSSSRLPSPCFGGADRDRVVLRQPVGTLGHATSGGTSKRPVEQRYRTAFQTCLFANLVLEG